MSDTTKQVEALIEKASQEGNAAQAMQFSQAALNAAQALTVLASLRLDDKT